jgi:tRNA pseudouridine38-40 synthase
MRYRLTIEYDGAPFCGWQSQADGGAVQDALVKAIENFCGETVTVFGAGRTDTGVHARGQVAHIDLAHAPRADKLRDAVNYHLKPQPVAVIDAVPARADFDARFSATARHYEYRLMPRRAPLTLDKAHAWWVPRALDVAAMDAAAKVLVGRHDFTTFRSTQCQAASTVRTLSQLDVRAAGDSIIIRTSARSFLHNQVRSLAGCLRMVGEGKWTAEDLTAALEARDRAACATVAPSAGLTLMQVDYPEDMLAAPEA